MQFLTETDCYMLACLQHGLAEIERQRSNSWEKRGAVKILEKFQVHAKKERRGIWRLQGTDVPDESARDGEACDYRWAFGLPEKFGSGISGSLKFGFSEMLPEICSKKSIPDISGTRKFGFGFGFTRYARNPPIPRGRCVAAAGEGGAVALGTGEGGVVALGTGA